MRIIGKLLILLLVFCIGFVSAFGALFGAGYYAYKNLSLDKVGVNTESVFDREAAEVQLSALTIEGLVSEIQTLQGISDKLTLDMMILRYGLIIPENVDAAIPQTARTLPLAKLFSKEGIVAVLDDVYIGQLLQYEKGELIPGTDGEYYWYQAGTTNEVTGLYSVLVNYTIGDLIKQNFDVNKIMADLTIAKVLNLSADNYSEAYIEVNGELVPFEGLEEEISIWRNSDGAMVSPTIAALADISVSELSTSLDDIAVSSLLGFVEQSEEYYSYEIDNNGVGEIVVLTKQTGLTAELSDLTVADFSNGGLDDKINEMKIATVLGYTYNEEDGKYYDSDGEAATGVTAVIAGSAIGEVGSDINNVMIGEVCGFTKVEDEDGNITWYDEYYGEGDERNVVAKGVMAAIAGSAIGSIDEDIDSVMVGEVCGFTKVEDEDGNIVAWYSEYYGEDDERNVPAKGVMASMADLTVGELGDDDAITARVETITVADALGYELDEDGEGYVDKNGDPVTGVMGVLAGTQLVNIQSTVDDTMVGELCGFTRVHVSGEGEDAVYKWYSEYDEEHPENNVEATGVMAVMVDLKVSELKDDDKITAKIETITVADALGYKPDASGDGYVDKNGKSVTGVMGVLAGTKLNGIQGKIDDTMIGEVSGFTKIEDGEGNITWYSKYDKEHPKNNVEAGGIMNAIADLKVSELKEDGKLTERIETLTVADALGYKPSGSGDGYLDKNNNPVTGVMGVIAGTKLNGIQAKIDGSKTGELMGLTYDEESGKWKDNGKDVHVLMNKIASTPFEDISGITSTLTVEDIIPADQRKQGFISLLAPDKKLDEIGPEVNRIFQEEPLKVFIKNEIIVVDDHLKPAFNDTDDTDELADMTLSDLFAYAAYAYMTQNGIPIIPEDDE